MYCFLFIFMIHKETRYARYKVTARGQYDRDAASYIYRSYGLLNDGGKSVCLCGVVSCKTCLFKNKTKQTTTTTAKEEKERVKE